MTSLRQSTFSWQISAIYNNNNVKLHSLPEGSQGERSAMNQSLLACCIVSYAIKVVSNKNCALTQIDLHLDVDIKRHQVVKQDLCLYTHTYCTCAVILVTEKGIMTTSDVLKILKVVFCCSD